jgi:hypothetical protein
MRGRWNGRCSAFKSPMASGSCRITGCLNLLDQDGRLPVGLLDLVLAELEVDGRRIVIRYQSLVADGVEEGLAATGTVVDVERAGAVARDDNAPTRASLASFLSLVRIQWLRPSIVLRLGVV